MCIPSSTVTIYIIQIYILFKSLYFVYLFLLILLFRLQI